MFDLKIYVVKSRIVQKHVFVYSP